jgi:hypothetical protein
MTVGLFIFKLKEINRIRSDKALFLIKDNIMIGSSDNFGYLKNKYKNETAMIFMIDCETAFG